ACAVCIMSLSTSDDTYDALRKFAYTYRPEFIRLNSYAAKCFEHQARDAGRGAALQTSRTADSELPCARRMEAGRPPAHGVSTRGTFWSGRAYRAGRNQGSG